MTLRCANLREELHTELERMLNDIIRFKIHIQGSLEGYEEFVAGEVEREWEEQAAALDDDAANPAAGNGDDMEE
jgi:kinetochore protein NDC80